VEKISAVPRIRLIFRPYFVFFDSRANSALTNNYHSSIACAKGPPGYQQAVQFVENRATVYKTMGYVFCRRFFQHADRF
jgi:hypothetical protein